MSETEKKIRTSKKSFIIALILLLLTNIIMGATLMIMSKESLRDQINQRMLDVANTAAYQINGDEIKVLTANDKETESYKRALNTLQSFQKNIQLSYIYGINPMPDGSFTFAIDPDPNNPADFGEPIETTDALINASKGKADIDKNAHTDEWGRFYTTYSPVFDSDGNVVGIIGVDFDADWYDGKLNSTRTVATLLTLASLIAGIGVSYYIMQQNKRRFSATIKNLSELDKETEKLDSIIMRSSIKKLDYMPEKDSAVLKTLASGEQNKPVEHTEYDEINKSIEAVYKKLSKYLRYVDSEVYTDDMTGLSNKAAYRKKVRGITEKIKAGNADFTVGFFNILELKKLYTLQGYEVGDAFMYECAKILKNLFGKENSFHIMGDDFIVVAEGLSEDDMRDAFAKFEIAMNEYNDKMEMGRRVTVAKGFAIYDPDKYENYRSLFVDAKLNCDSDKADYYERKRVEDERYSILGY